MIGVSCTGFCSKDFKEIWNDVSSNFSHWEIFSEGTNSVQGISCDFVNHVSEYSMSYSLHSSIADTNVAAVNDCMRSATLRELCSEMDHMRMMDLDMMTVHPGVSSLVCSDLRGRSLECAKLTMRDLNKASLDSGVKVAIENMPNLPFMLGRTAQELSEIIDGTELGVCFDIGHANTMGEIENMVDTFKERIINIHIHDNMGDRDAHLTLGEGNIDFRHVIDIMSGYSGNYIIESKTLESAVISKSILGHFLA